MRARERAAGGPRFANGIETRGGALDEPSWFQPVTVSLCCFLYFPGVV